MPALGPNARGVLWFTASGACYIVAWTIVRDLATDISVFEIAFFRAVFGLVFMGSWLVRTGLDGIKTRRAHIHFLRVTLSTSSLWCVIGALVYLPVADMTALGFTRPIFTVIAAILILRETAGPMRILATLIGFVGAMIIIRPGMEAINIGVVLAIASAALTSLAMITVKALSRTEAPDTIAMYVPIFGLPLSLVPTLFVWITPSWEQLGWMALIGLFTTLAQRAISRAYAAAEVTVIQPFDFLRLPMAAAFGFAVFAELPDVWVWVGGAVIFASGLSITLHEARRARAASGRRGPGRRWLGHRGLGRR
ncbi:MAG: DMT family transporter [Alphaproteobacteria bacterium]